jgi:hypothetical protein
VLRAGSAPHQARPRRRAQRENGVPFGVLWNATEKGSLPSGPVNLRTR